MPRVLFPGKSFETKVNINLNSKIMEAIAETAAMQEYWIGNFFAVLGREPELYRECMIARIRSLGERPTLENHYYFREFISCWIFVHAFILHEHVFAIEDGELRDKVQKMAMNEITVVCRTEKAAGSILAEFLTELETRNELSDPGCGFSPGNMLAWYYCKRLQVVSRLRPNPSSLSELPSKAELSLIARLTDDTIPMTLQSFDHLLKPGLGSR